MIQAHSLEFRYRADGFWLRLEDFRVAAGERVAIIGPSGAGKTTLLKLIAGILKPTAGTLCVEDLPLHQADDAARRSFRVRRIGFVFQELELLDYLNVLDNILHAYRINPVLKLDRGVRERAAGLAADVGLAEKLSRLPRELSQGERQRVSVCRALLPGPGLILADEPTGNLDPANKFRILDLLMQAAERHGASLLTVTHDHELLPRFDRVFNFASFQG